jgi:molybdenum cofactor cytidylyltransferase
MIELCKALRLGGAPQVAFVGAGGKTTAMFTLARQFDKPVLVTTSTHLGTNQLGFADQHIVVSSVEEISRLDPDALPAVSVITGGDAGNDRVAGLSEETLAALSAYAREHGLPLLIEADGARERSLKAPAEHEPAIPPFVDHVVVVAGLSGLGQPQSENSVHRLEQYSTLAELKPGEPIDGGAIARVLAHPQGGLKNISPRARRVVLLNQADKLALEAAAKTISVQLLGSYDAVLVAALRHSPEVKTVYEHVAGIVLAAGGSQRLGRSKQLLDWKGKPFVRQVAETALAAGLDPVVVVTGAEGDKVEAALTRLNVVIARNLAWAEGQSGSVKAGLAALPGKVGAAMFLVTDQPQLPVALIEALRAEHASTLAPIIAPLVDGNRSNPVLFDRRTFPDFAELHGEVGGRALFSKHHVSWLPWLDNSLAIDVDRPEDYDRLLRQAG